MNTPQVELDCLLKRLVGYEDVAEDIRSMFEERTTKMSEWHSVESAPEDVVVETKIDDTRGCWNEQEMRRRGRLWWYPDNSMYVYYEPTHWRRSQS